MDYKWVVGTAITCIGGLWVAARAVLGYYFRQSEKLEEFKDNHITHSILELREVVHEHTSQMVSQAKEIQELEKKLDIAIARYSQYQDSHETVLDSLRSFVDANNQRIVAIEGRVIELGKDVYMIKSKGSRG